MVVQEACELELLDCVFLADLEVGLGEVRVEASRLEVPFPEVPFPVAKEELAVDRLLIKTAADPLEVDLEGDLEA